MYTGSSQLEVDATYSSSSNIVYEGIVVKSSDPSVVSVSDIAFSDGNLKCTLNGLKVGEADVTVMTQASGKKTKFKVKVTADNIKTNVTTATGTKVSEGDTFTSRNKDGITFNYSFNKEDLLSKDLSVKLSNDCVKFVPNTTKGTFTLTGIKSGKTKVTVYPSIGTPDKNGFSFWVDVKADIKTANFEFMPSVAVGSKKKRIKYNEKCV